MLTALAGCDIDALVFTAEMYGVQLDQLAAVLAVPVERARGVAARWRSLGLAESARLGPGPPWVWATRPGMAACGLGYPAGPPPLSRLAHIRAVTAVRLALQATTAYQRARAFWRGERRIRAAVRAGLRDHLPDGELHCRPGRPCPGPTNAGPSRPNSPARRSPARPRSCGNCSPGPATTAVPAPRPPNRAGRPGTPGRSTSAPPPRCRAWPGPGTSWARSAPG